jgi:hypothetical protein
MNLVRQLKGWIYSRYSSSSAKLHEKRRKGLFYRFVPAEILTCQIEQDRIFWEKFLRPKMGGVFWEVGAGDGVVGSHTLGLEIKCGWEGTNFEPHKHPSLYAAKVRKCRMVATNKEFGSEKKPDLVAIHRPQEFPVIWERLDEGLIAPQWVIVENAQPDPKWCRFLERLGYELRFFFHDDEYYEFQA